MRRTIITSLACIVTLSVAAAFAQSDTASRAEPITDPWLLQRWGFAPDATNVYASPRVQAELVRIASGVPETDAARKSDPIASEAEAASSFGDELGHTLIDQAAFHPQRSTTVHEFDPAGGRLCVEGDPWFEGVFDGLPHGARITHLRFWTFDLSTAENIIGFVKRTCNQDIGGPLMTILAGYASFGSGGFQSAIDFADPDGIDTRCTYTAVFRLDGQESASCSEGDDLRIVGAGARWIREVSPAPDIATFDDVPTTHLFFRHIEALAASGITGGCDENSFCPEAPLTRAQMAAFLAKALGL